MKIKCPNSDCLSDDLDEGLDGRVLCHKCNRTYYLIATWVVPNMDKEYKDD
jgi:hypothetical protein